VENFSFNSAFRTK